MKKKIELTQQERMERLDHILNHMGKEYRRLVWFGGTDENKLITDEEYELLEEWEKLEAPFEYSLGGSMLPKFSKHLFNCGVLTCIKILEVGLNDWWIKDERRDGRHMTDQLFFDDFTIDPKEIFDLENKVRMTIEGDGRLYKDGELSY